MTTASSSLAARAQSRWAAIRREAAQRLRGRGPLPREEWIDLEGAVQGTLQPVQPQSGFRENLRENLALAARGRSTGLAVAPPTEVRQSLYLGITAGLLAVAIAALLVFSRYRATTD